MKNRKFKLNVLLVTLLLSSMNVNARDLQYGISFISPGGINFTTKATIAELPLQASIGYLADDMYGFEFGYSFLKNSSRTFRSVQLVAGSTKISRREWDYAGLSATFQRGGFYVEPSILVGSGDYSNPQISMQIGYLWQ